MTHPPGPQMTPRRFIACLVAGILGLNLLVICFSWLYLAKSRHQYTEKAAVTAQNLARVLEQDINGTIGKIDIGVLDLAREVERQIAGGGIDERRLIAYMELSQSHLPEIDGLKVANAQGKVVFGLTPFSGPLIDISDRDYFVRLRDNSREQLVVSKPFKGRRIPRWTISLARRINRPDGTFAGVAFGTLPLENIVRLFSSINVGTFGAFVLRDGTDLGLVARYPEPEGIGKSVGQVKIPDELTSLLKQGTVSGSYDAASAHDTRVRTWGFRRFDGNRYYIFAGLAKDEYLSDWRNEAVMAGIFLCIFSLASIIAGRATYLGWKRNKAVEESFRANNDRMRLFFERQIVGMAISSPDKHWLQINDKWCQILGYGRDELNNMTWEEVTHPDDLPENMDKFNQLVAGQIDDYTITKRFIRKDGTVILANLSVGSVRNEDGTLNCLLSLMEDVTERKRDEEERLKLEQQLLHAQKLESLGVLAGGIAHDFNNILMAIIGNADLALMRINRESPAVENLHRIEQAAARAADLAKQMLAYSGKGKFVVESIDLNTLLEEMLHMLEVSISKKAVLRLNPFHPLPPVEADATQMRQIIMNLVINASEAIGDMSGVIAITTGCMDCDTHYLDDVWLNENITEGLYVYLEIADSGCGMDKETLAKLFDPFFTTKFTGRGLGMAAVLGIVRGHKGAIKVYSELHKGTTFKILLPASGKPAEIFNGHTLPDDWQGHGTVLLVDDEETVRGIGVEMLKELGFSTITANDGREAVEIFRERPDITFVILDLTMPHMDGEQCFRELRQIRSGVKVIMSSGFNEQEVTQKFVGKGLAGFIQKPYKV
ncbi:MAG: PAS domain S-box protein, partial [Geobacteraceae bacterium]|nr:PAS domain S-box protein [Geobacteraceae bacterium]